MQVGKRNLWHDRFKMYGRQVYIDFAKKFNSEIDKYHATKEMAIIKKT